jgi:ABC-2 type transport system ATP-binding protein
MATNAIEVEHVTKRYGDTVALDDVSLNVPDGSIFGIIGPNGSGKSTLVNLLAGLRPPSAGTVSVMGIDPERAGRRLRERIGLQLQDAHLQDQITVQEALRLYASFYRNPAPWRPLVDSWGLDKKLDAKFSQLSGGQKQRLLICLALINQPELVILDELTTGLDPAARRESWEHVRRIRELGTTVILVTHFMEEAQVLCDTIALFARGKIIRTGTPEELLRGGSGTLKVAFTAPPTFDEESLLGRDGVTGVSRRGTTVEVTGTGYLMATVSQALATLHLNPFDLRTESTSLDDMFIELTQD